MSNPENFLYKSMIAVESPFDLRGSVVMNYAYDDNREDSCFAYVPMLRRLRRVSAATRSDPFLGSDVCPDDTEGWGGKNTSMNWKLIEKKTLFGILTSAQLHSSKKLPDGVFELIRVGLKHGYDMPNWPGISWAPLSLVWSLRPMYVIEAVAKDKYYNFGRQILYIDAETYQNYFKVCFSQSGEYWRTLLNAFCWQKTEHGMIMSFQDITLCVDDKTRHATNVPMEPDVAKERPGVCLLPENHLYGPDYFTESSVRQLSK